MINYANQLMVVASYLMDRYDGGNQHFHLTLRNCINIFPKMSNYFFKKI